MNAHIEGRILVENTNRMSSCDGSSGPGAYSYKSLDLDILTYDTLYIKSLPGPLISSYTVPVLLPSSTPVKRFSYFTIQQALSAGGVEFNVSSIPNLLGQLSAISTHQYFTDQAISSFSSVTGSNIESLVQDTQDYYTLTQNITFTATYFAMYNAFLSTVRTNNSTLQLQSNFFYLTSNLSSISTAVTSTLTSLDTNLNVLYNQGPSVSTMSTFVTQYFRNLSESISTYSTSVGAGISTNFFLQTSTLTNFGVQVQNIVVAATGPGVSTLSTIITSSFQSIANTTFIYNPGPGLSSMSTFMVSSLSSLSSLFDIQLAVPGICSLSTFFTRAYLCTLSNAFIIAGVPQISSMSTTVDSNASSILAFINNAASPAGICSLSTVLGTEVKLISDIICTVNYNYILIQQEQVKTSVSTTSTAFGLSYVTLTSLSTFSTLLPSAYSTISTVFDIVSPSNSINTLSTQQASTTIFLSSYISTNLPAVFAGPGLSSLSTFVPIMFSTLSTNFGIVFSTFSNDITNISALRADVGVSSLSSFVGVSTVTLQSNFNFLFENVSTINTSTMTILSNISTLYEYDRFTYSNLNQPVPLQTLAADLSLQLCSISTTIDSQLLPAIGLTSSLSTQVSSLISSFSNQFVGLQSTYVSTLSSIYIDYYQLSSLVNQNLFSPTFSSFTSDLVIASTMTVRNTFYVSSLGVSQSTSSVYKFAVQGSTRFYPITKTGVQYVQANLSTNSRTLFTTSTLLGPYASTGSNQFTIAANDVAYNGSNWVAVGVDVNTSKNIKYSRDPSQGWNDATLNFTTTEFISANKVKWSGSYWLAGANSNPSIVRSPDGITWDPANIGSNLSSVKTLAWNGFVWSAGGYTGGPWSMIYSEDGSNWNVADNSFSTMTNDIATNGQLWVAVGQASTIKYSYDAVNWTNLVGTAFSTSGNTVGWNGEKFVALGQNTNSSNAAYSYNGQDWTLSLLPSTSRGLSVIWNGNQWIATAIHSVFPSTAVQLTSFNGISWSTVGGQLFQPIQAQAYASNIMPDLQFSNFDIYTNDIPVILDSRKRMQIIQSTIMFNDGDLTIRKVQISTLVTGYVGINTTYPEYALDIGVGNARKPIGTTWITASDQRIKKDIETADLFSCAQYVQQIPLRQFRFNEEFQRKTKTNNDLQYGFIAQEVKRVLPNSITYTQEYGLSDFHSLDTDQIHKLEFGATQYLLQKIDYLEAEVTRLEDLLKKK